MSYLHYLCYLRLVMSNTYCVEFLLCFSSCHVYPMLPVSLDCPLRYSLKSI